jgi:hypothetical protein
VRRHAQVAALAHKIRRIETLSPPTVTRPIPGTSCIPVASHTRLRQTPMRVLARAKKQREIRSDADLDSMADFFESTLAGISEPSRTGLACSLDL